jgi:hypothetical protein
MIAKREVRSKENKYCIYFSLNKIQSKLFTYTYPYEHTHTYSTPMSTFKRLRQHIVLRLTESQAPSYAMYTSPPIEHTTPKGLK